MTTEALVKPANIQEQLLGKIGEMRQNNLTAKQKQNIQEYIKEYSDDLRKSFERLTWKRFGISESQIQELSDQELGALFLLVYERAKKSSICHKILFYSTFVWIIAFPCKPPDSVLLTNCTRKLRSILGNGFNPVKLIRNQRRP